jgi:hypothetical protein
MAEAAVTAGRKMQGLQGHSQVRARCNACRSCQLSAEQTAGQVASANSHIEKTSGTGRGRAASSKACSPPGPPQHGAQIEATTRVAGKQIDEPQRTPLTQQTLTLPNLHR